jgi:hypothetical protein
MAAGATGGAGGRPGVKREAMPRRPMLALVVTLSVAAAACGDDPEQRFAKRTPPERSSAEPLRQSERAAEQAERRARARPTRSDAERMRPVLRGWGEALRRDRAARAARYFTVPAIVAQGNALTLTSAAQIREFNDAFPCGAKLLHVQEEGRFLVGTFELTRRPQHKCSSVGELLRVAFALRKRKIAEWREIPQPTDAGPAQPEDAPDPPAQTTA